MNLPNPSERVGGPRRRMFFIRLALAACALLVVGGTAGALALHTFAAAPTNVALPNTVAPQVAAAKLVGPTATGQKIQVTLSLRSKNEAGLRDYASQVAEPKSKLYRQYLSPAQYAQIFGANAATVGSAEQYLQSQGFHLDNSMSGGLLLNFTGTVAQAESAFHVHINNYTLGGQQFFANAENIQIPASLSGQLFNVAGLDTARQFHAGTVAGKAPQTTATPKASISVTCPTGPTVTAVTGSTSFYANGLRAADLQKVYNFPTYVNSPGNNGWAAMIEFDGFQVYDLQQYEICANINGTIQAATGTSPSASNPFIIVQNTATSFSSTPAAGANYGTPMAPGNAAAAVTGDLETLIGLAPYLQHISVVQNNPTPQGMLVALSVVANQDAAQTVGIPWGMCEADVGFANASAEEYFFMQMALQGQSAFAATGNYGLYSCYGDFNSGGNVFRTYTFTAQDPASDPYVTAVGGTTLGTTGVAGAPGTGTVTGWASEQPWNNYPVTGTNVPTVGQGFLGGAGGGAVSLFWAAPIWQQNAKATFTTNPNVGAGLIGVLSSYQLNNATNPNNVIPARVIPDVSAVADPVNTPVSIYCQVGATPCQTNATTFTTVGGTGIATAIWVAAATLAVQSANPSANTGTVQAGIRIGLAAPNLYLAYQNDLTTSAGTTTFAGSKFCDYNYLLTATTPATLSTAVYTTGLVTVVPASMTGILNNMQVVIGGVTPETLAVSGATTSSFQLTITNNTHIAGVTITPKPVVADAEVIAGGGGNTGSPGVGTITLNSVANIVTGMYLLVGAGTGTAETVQVLGVNVGANKVTANFTNAHVATETVQATLTSTNGTTALVTTTTSYAVGNVAGNQAVAVSSTTGLVAGGLLLVDQTAAQQESVTLVSVNKTGTDSYIVAPFTKTHAAGQQIFLPNRFANASGFATSCSTLTATTGSFILNNSAPLSTTANTVVTSSFPTSNTLSFQQLPTGTPTAIYGSAAGFAVKGNNGVPNTYVSGYNALTGLGSPNVGTLNSAAIGANTNGTGLNAYLAAATRVSIPRIYLVAQAQSTSTYWLGAYAFNPYLQNMPVYTQWYQLSSAQVFSGPPTIVDDGYFAGTGANAAQNLLIIGPSNGAANAYAVIDWNINNQSATILPVSGVSIPSSTAGNTSCSNVTAFTNATTVAVGTAFSKVGLYCLTPAGNVYVTNLGTFSPAAATGYTSVSQAAWAAAPVLSNVSSAPMVATDGAGNYEVVVQTTGTSYNVVYTQTPISSFAATGATGVAAYGTMLTLLTTCNSTPAISYVTQTMKYMIACIAKDTNAMWANAYDANTKNFSAFWTLLGQPSSSVTFLPGDAVAVDNIATDPGYGMAFYIAEGSDKGMYLSVVNTANSNFLFKSSMWQGVSLPGIFSSGAAAAFENN